MSTATVSFPAIGTTAQVVVTEPRRLAAAERVLRDRLDEFDRTCSRFRADSEISRLHHRAGTAVTVSPLLFGAMTAALTAAATTGGLVDPTVGTSMRLLGYDRDFAAVLPDDRLDPSERFPFHAQHHEMRVTGRFRGRRGDRPGTEHEQHQQNQRTTVPAHQSTPRSGSNSVRSRVDTMACP